MKSRRKGQGRGRGKEKKGSRVGRGGPQGEERERKVGQTCSRETSSFGQGPNLVAWQHKKPTQADKTGSKHISPALIFLTHIPWQSPCHSFPGSARGLQSGGEEGDLCQRSNFTEDRWEGGKKKRNHRGTSWPLVQCRRHIQLRL